MDIDSVLNQMRQEHSPTEGDRERVRAALSTALIVSGTAGAAHVATTAGLKGATAVEGGALVNGASVVKGALALPVWIKSAVGVGALVAAVGGGVYGAKAYRAAPAQVAQSASAPSDQAEHRMPDVAFRGDEAPVVGPVGPAIEPTAQAIAQPLPMMRRVETASKAARPNSAPPTASSGAVLTSLGELRLIGEASKAIREGRTDEARSALSEHEKRYSNTALGQERSGLDLLARCAESNSEATRQAAEVFLRRSPKSPLAGSIRRECLE